MRNTAQEIHDHIRANGGATVQLYFGDDHLMDARDGDVYIVGGAHDVPGYRVPLGAFDAAEVQDALSWAKRELYPIMTAFSALGFWVHEGEVHVDLVDAIMGREYALAVAEERGELAIFGLAAGEEIFTSHKTQEVA